METFAETMQRITDERDQAIKLIEKLKTDLAIAKRELDTAVAALKSGVRIDRDYATQIPTED